MLPDKPLFTFEHEIQWYQGGFWLCEVCVLYTGERFVMEMVKLESEDVYRASESQETAEG